MNRLSALHVLIKRVQLFIFYIQPNSEWNHPYIPSAAKSEP